MQSRPFSKKLELWLKSDNDKTLSGLLKVFAEKSFAIIVLILMFVPALPLPTGGVTHVFEVITMLVALEMMVGMKTVWLPKWAKQRKLGEATQEKAVPFIIRRIRWFEKFSRPRLKGILDHGLFTRFVGLLFFILALAAAFAVPFSGLDTLPALGAVIIALSLILGDVVLFIAGCVVGTVGVGLVIAFGAVTFDIIKHFI